MTAIDLLNLNKCRSMVRLLSSNAVVPGGVRRVKNRGGPPCDSPTGDKHQVRRRRNDGRLSSGFTITANIGTVARVSRISKASGRACDQGRFFPWSSIRARPLLDFGLEFRVRETKMTAITAQYVAMLYNNKPEQLKTPEQAKEQVFANWSRLEDLCKRRFPTSENLAHEGLLYVLEQLEANEWQRVRTWGGTGRFLTYLLTLAARLLTDFTRSRFGHIRMPEWLSEKKDPVWSGAYRLLMVEGFERREAVEILQMRHPARERWFIEEVVATIRARCRTPTRVREPGVPIEENREFASNEYSPESELGITEREMLAAIRELLDARDPSDAPNTQRVIELVKQLRPYMKITEEDRMFLRLRHIDGLQMKEIVKLLGVKGDAYKRYHRILSSLREAWLQAGLLSADGEG